MFIRNIGAELNGNSKYKGYIKYCGNYNNIFVFREELLNGKSCNIYVDIIKRIERKKENLFKNIVSMCIDKDIEYYICKNPICVFKKNVNSIQSYTIPISDRYTPLSINIIQNKIIITFMPALMIICSVENIDIENTIDLTMIDGIEPISVTGYLEKQYFITDSSNHTVVLINEQGKVLWKYGKTGWPGIEENELCVPTNTIVYDKDKIIISEQRSHRINIINMKTNKRTIYGLTNMVGGDGIRLWAPQAVFLDGKLYAVVCKGANISISVLESYSREWKLVYGKNILYKSDLNFPRACEFNLNLNLLAVADTYHDRIIVYNMMADIVKIIDRTIIPNLSWPRSVFWIADDLIITDSKNGGIYILDLAGKIKETFFLPYELRKNHWLQSAEMKNGKMLITIDDSVILMSWNEKKIIWNSKDENLIINDAHYSQIISDDSFLISDTGNNRGILVKNGSSYYLDKIYYKGEEVKLNKPRMMKIYGSLIYIVNSADSKILICDLFTLNVIKIIGENRGLANERYSMPRWLCIGNKNNFFLSDTDNHRIIEYDLQNLR